MILGLGLSSNKFLQETMGGLSSACKVPSQHLLGATRRCLWFGLNRERHSVRRPHGIVALGNDRHGRRSQADAEDLRQAGRNLGARGFKLFWHVLLPASLPFIVSGLKQGWAFAWRSLIQAEMIYLSLGLGQLLMMGRDLNDMSAVIAVMFLIIVLGYMVDGLVFKGMERHLQNKWGLAPAN